VASSPIFGKCAQLFVLCWLAACTRYRLPERCPSLEFAPTEITAKPKRPLYDLAQLKTYRSYAAVTDVQPEGHHFVVTYHHVEPHLTYLRASRDSQGQIVFTPESDYWGGIVGEELPPVPEASLPPEVVPYQQALEARFARCASASHVRIAYAGSYRLVSLREFILTPSYVAGGPPAGGWTAWETLAMDAKLERISHPVEQTSGFGVVELPARASFWRLPTNTGARLLLLDPLASMEREISQAARAFVENTPSFDPRTAEPADAPLLPEGYPTRLELEVKLYPDAPAHEHTSSSTQALRATFNVNDVVFGPRSEARDEVSLGGADPRKLTLEARLTPATPVARGQGYARHDAFLASLEVTVHDDDGHTWQHTYPARGLVETEGDRAVAPFGFLLPGQSSPSPEADALRGTLPAKPPSSTIRVVVNLELSTDPRR
jgi:hypothetical protein